MPEDNSKPTVIRGVRGRHFIGMKYYDDNQANQCVTTMPIVTCGVCGRHFTDTVYNEKQAWHCASYCTNPDGRDVIFCKYGSKFDWDAYDFADGVAPDNWKEVDPICDYCLVTAIASGLLVLVQ